MKSMDEIRNEYEQQLSELNTCIERLRSALIYERAQNDDLQQEVLFLKKQISEPEVLTQGKEAYYQNLIAQYSTSVSWRITKPVRFVGRILKKVIRRNRK